MSSVDTKCVVASHLLVAPPTHPDILLAAEGLARDIRALPSFSLWELFETLLRSNKIRRAGIRHKLAALLQYLSQADNNGIYMPLRRQLCTDLDATLAIMEDDGLLHDSGLLHLFAYAFGLRLEILRVSGNHLCAQYFGLADKPMRRIFACDDNYVLLKRVFAKTRKTSYGLNSAIGSPRSKLRKEASMHTSATTTAELISMHPCMSSHSSDAESHNSEPIAVVSDQQCALTSPELLISSSQLNPQSPCLDSEPHEFPFTLSNGVRVQGKSLGRLKFFNEAKEYGFIICDDDSEIFVHKADLLKQNIDTRYLAYYKKYYDIVMEFNVQEYQGKAKKHRKAVDVLIFDMQLLC